MLKNSVKLRIIITFVSLFLIVGILLLLIFFAGKKTYVVTFDLDGGTLISGSLEQHVTQGQDAYPPNVAKSGAYFHSWSGSYKKVTSDVVVTAVWEYETTPGISYDVGEDQNYAEIDGAFKYINGDVYLGAFHNGKKILGIKDYAFRDCRQITNVFLLNGLIYIGNEAFADCVSLSKIEIPETVTHLGNGVFSGCESMQSVVLYDGLKEIGDSAFENCTSITEIVIPKTVTSIGAGAFRGCKSLTKVVLHEGVREIGDGAFEGCESLTEIVVPKTVDSIGSSAFKGCKALASVSLSSGLNSIGANAFEGCVALTKVTIPASVDVMGTGVFAECGELTVTVNRRLIYRGWEEGWEGNAVVEYVGFIINPTIRPNFPDFDEPEELVPDTGEVGKGEGSGGGADAEDEDGKIDEGLIIRPIRRQIVSLG